MTDTAGIKAAAEALFADNQARRPYRPLADTLGLADLDEAYRAQDEYCKLLQAAGAGPLAGYKIALTSAAMQRMVGLDQPCIGTLFADVVHTSPAALHRADYRHLGIECEMAVRLGRDLPADGAPYDRDQVRAAVAECLPAFELIEDRDADYGNLDAMSLIAENCWNAGAVLANPAATGAHSIWSKRRRLSKSTARWPTAGAPATPWAIPWKWSPGSQTTWPAAAGRSRPA